MCSHARIHCYTSPIHCLKAKEGKAMWNGVKAKTAMSAFFLHFYLLSYEGNLPHQDDDDGDGRSRKKIIIYNDSFTL